MKAHLSGYYEEYFMLLMTLLQTCLYTCPSNPLKFLHLVSLTLLWKTLLKIPWSTT